MPVTTPAAGAPPYSLYMSWAAQRPSSWKLGIGEGAGELPAFPNA